jgi:uncharacterized protein (DUF2267 family)
MDRLTFIREVADRLGCDDPRAEAVTFAVFRELRLRLTGKEAVDVASQLPTGLRRLWEEPAGAEGPTAKIHAPEFVGRVRRFAALPDDAEAARAVRAVFATLQRLLGSPTGMEGEAWDVLSVLPKDLKLLWLFAGKDATVEKHMRPGGAGKVAAGREGGQR